MVDEVEAAIPSFHVEEVSVTEKLQRRRFAEARTATIRRGTWLVGTWSCFLVAIGATWYWEGPERGKVVALFILGEAIFTGLYGVYYACKVGFVLSLLGKSRSDELSFSTVVWVTLWATLVGGGVGFSLALLVVRGHFVSVLLSSGAAYLLGATIGNRLVRRKYPRVAA